MDEKCFGEKLREIANEPTHIWLDKVNNSFGKKVVKAKRPQLKLISNDSPFLPSTKRPTETHSS